MITDVTQNSYKTSSFRITLFYGIIYSMGTEQKKNWEGKTYPFSSSESACIYNTILSDTLYKIIGLFIYKNNDSLAAC